MGTAVDPMTRHWVGKVVCVVSLCLIAGSEWHRVFGWGPIEWRIIAAVSLATVVAVAFRRWRPEGVVIASVASLALLFWFVAVVVLGDSIGAIIPSAGSFGGVVSGLVNGWAQILSVPLPVQPNGEFLVLPVVLTWLAALIGVELALRSTRPLGATIPPVVAYVTALFFGIGGPGSRLALSGAVVAVTLVMAGITARPIVADEHRDPRVRVRRYGEIAGSLTAIVAVAVLLGPSLPGVSSGAPYDPRTSRVPPQLPASAYNPLDELSQWAKAPNNPALFTVHTANPEPIRLAVLDQYNPVDGWTQSSSFEPAGTALPGPGAQVRRVADVQSVTLRSLPAPWLPAAERPVTLTGVQAFVDPSTGVLVAASGPKTNAYRVQSAFSTATGATCTHDTTVNPPASATVVPTIFSTLAQQYTAAALSPCARADALVQAFKNHYTFDAKAPSGSSVAVLENFVQGPAPNGGKGTSEQFASAFALMADSLSMNARVVVGFFPGHEIAPDTYEVGPHDAMAWVEVQFQREGWVPFFPQARTGGAPPGEATDQQKSVVRSVPVISSGSGKGSGPIRQVLSAPPAQTSTLEAAVVAIALIVAGLAVLLLWVAAIVWLIRRRRRRRRRECTEPRDRVMGAWEESLDALVSAGVARRASDTADELVAAGVARLGDSSSGTLLPLGALSNESWFSSDPVGVDDAERAWRYADEVGITARASMGFWGRVRRALDLRIVWRRHLH
jgi:transglutaminase-like putative cysteine protease